MFKSSVVTHTGQLWKLVLACLAILVGSFAPLWPASGLTWTTGTLLAVVAFFAGALAIRCPACGNRWFWDALMRPENYGPLLSRPDCPACGHDYGAGRPQAPPPVG
jgi:hypothetical protein